MPLSDAERDLLRRGARRFGIELPPAQIAAMGRYLDLLLQWRRHARLISQRQSRSEIIGKHIIDSLALVAQLEGRHHVADIGSGAGLPGVPLAIVKPDAWVTLIDANRRKANFLREVVRELALVNAKVVEARAEDIEADHTYDAVVSRALGAAAGLLACARRMIAPDGIVVAMKGPSVDQELAANEPSKLGFSLRMLHRYSLETGERRVLAVFAPEPAR